MKHTISELKNIVEGIKSRLDEGKDQISDVEDKVERNTQKGQEKEQTQKEHRGVERNAGQHEMSI